MSWACAGRALTGRSTKISSDPGRTQNRALTVFEGAPWRAGRVLSFHAGVTDLCVPVDRGPCVRAYLGAAAQLPTFLLFPLVPRCIQVF